MRKTTQNSQKEMNAFENTAPEKNTSDHIMHIHDNAQLPREYS